MVAYKTYSHNRQQNALNLLSFEAHFGLSAQEKEYLADCNYLLEISARW